ncbi:MAG TPA: beta-lactamase family protein [Anaerolineae bacterium]|nr:beta-lactamase family protein [Anaerolineae bacterium]
MKIDAVRLRECIRDQAEPEPFSGVVHLTKGEEVLFEEGLGLAIRAERIPNTVDTRFQTASGCKIFTSVAVCRLVEQGKLSFDALLSECVDVTFPNFAPEITIHHLLTHSSGITSYFEEDVDPDYEALWRDLPMYRVRGPRDFLPLFQHKSMKFAPGERFEYNDGGYILLGLVVESVAGVDFTTFVQENVFMAAGMLDSGYFAADRLPERTAYAYIKDDDAWRTNIFAVPIIGGADGGAYTTAPDMARFWRALTSERLLSADLKSQLLEPQIVTTGDSASTHYGYGVWIDQAEGSMRSYFVAGFDPGVAMKSSFYPEENRILTVIGNTSHAVWPLCEKLEALLGL